jgi:5'-nucleotidase
MEAAIGGLPGIAFSLDSPIGLNGQRDFSAASAICRRVATRVAAAGLPRQTLLNVNIPYLPLEEIKGVQVTRLGMRVYRDELVRRIDPQHNPYYWIGGEAPTGQPDEGTEVAALQAGYVSVTPLHMDMTSFNLIPELAGWSW